ncbi:MAG: hypothetical protein LBH12_02500 [Dysgonamonadaceae bacterium]|jgi:hypothetical protein|nr:hypothetical protein [Dysgonamonadaceae bacterium]
MDTKKTLNKMLPHLGILLFFFLIVFVYFQPAFEGKILMQSDIAHLSGVAQETLEYGQSTGWTGSVFSGMPTYQITGYETSPNFIKQLFALIYSDTVGPVFFFLVTSYFLFILLGVPWWLAALGAIASAFSSYNLIIIVAGHITKVWVLAFVPLVLAGLYLVFTRKYWAGLMVFSLGLSLLIAINHLQITYYVAIFCLILFAGFTLHSLLKKEYKSLGIASIALFFGIVTAVLTNLSGLYINYESGQESTRGKTELTPLNNESKVTDGLEKDYVFAWSQGIDETLSLIIPNIKGGASGGTLDKNSHLYKELKQQGAQVGKEIRTNTYWGEKAFTAGPVYFGAVISFLFLFALFIIPQKYKWWLFGSTVLFIFLAWGKNMAWFNDFMYYYFPLYNKFRTVETALVIPGFIFPILAVLGINELVNGNPEKKKLKTALFWSGGITAGICFVLWIMPGLFFNFESGYDAQYNLPDWYLLALAEDRKNLLQADALRSLIFIAWTAGLIFLYIQSKKKKSSLSIMAVGLIVLVLVDMWQIDKRYLNHSMFQSRKSHNEQLFTQTTADRIILQDTHLSYRVLNLNNPFQDSRTSYYHKSLGGYSAAKLGRYQDLIDRRLTKEINSITDVFGQASANTDFYEVFEKSPSLNMLNAKYFIYNPDAAPLINPYACGNAWFVNSYRFTDTPDEEMAALETLDPQTEAVLDKQFEANLANLKIIPDESASIEITAYSPNKVEYRSFSDQTGLAVFSEIYYKNGWKAFIDGEQVPISRADWILRAIVIPAGEHQVEFVFDPDNVRTFSTITTVFSGLLILLIIGSIVAFLRKQPGKNE